MIELNGVSSGAGSATPVLRPLTLNLKRSKTPAAAQVSYVLNHSALPNYQATRRQTKNDANNKNHANLQF